jgi:hypothetical protein
MNRNQPYDTEKKLGELLSNLMYAVLKAEAADKEVRVIKRKISDLGFDVELDPNLKIYPHDLTPLGPPLTPIDAVVTVGGTTTQRTRSVCVLPHSITPSGASIEDVEVLPDV